MPIRWRSGSGVNGRDQLVRGAAELGVELDGAAVERLLKYIGELVKWNRRYNLVARGTGTEELLEKHFLDSLTLLPLLRPDDRLMDVGSGAGFPGLVLAAVRPDLDVTLVEPRQKRASFLGHVVRLLGLVQVRVLGVRLDGVDRQLRPTLITGRAVAEPAAFLKLVGERADAACRVILMAAKEAGLEECAAASGFSRMELHRLRLPFSGAPRMVAVLRRCD